MDISQLIEILHHEKCSCVIANKDRIATFHQRGVRDLYDLLNGNPSLLSGSLIADKVVGKGAAALMIVGGVVSVYADVISRPALDLFIASGLTVSYGICVPNIVNRTATGICPVETLCLECKTASECIPLIEKFIQQNNKQHAINNSDI